MNGPYWIPDQWWIQDFLEEGAPTPRGGATYDFVKISQKLHEIERIWTPRGRVLRALLRSATVDQYTERHMTKQGSRNSDRTGYKSYICYTISRIIHQILKRVGPLKEFMELLLGFASRVFHSLYKLLRNERN